ncbi:hypothetical protein B0H14DRAFT_2339403, partial [Mycena olivaceomarginata]
HICFFRHALALDERRVKFLPEYIGTGCSMLGESPNVKKVWFAGTHSAIGGGKKRDLELSLSSAALIWMENEATAAGL